MALFLLLLSKALVNMLAFILAIGFDIDFLGKGKQGKCKNGGKRDGSI